MNKDWVYEVGQRLYFEPCEYRSRSHRPEEVTVQSIGRRWVNLSNGYRIDKATGYADGKGFTPPGRCYPDKATRIAEIARDSAWHELRKHLGHRAPARVTYLDIKQAADLLGVELPDASAKDPGHA